MEFEFKELIDVLDKKDMYSEKDLPPLMHTRGGESPLIKYWVCPVHNLTIREGKECPLCVLDGRPSIKEELKGRKGKETTKWGKQTREEALKKLRKYNINQYSNKEKVEAKKKQMRNLHKCKRIGAGYDAFDPFKAYKFNPYKSNKSK